MNLPNKLSILRILLIPVFTVFFFLPQIPFNYVISASIFAIAAATDFLDGHIARKYNLVTNLGKFIDPIADKALVATALIILITNPIITLGCAVGFNCTVIFSVGVAIILVRELMISGFRMIAAKQQVVLAADKIGKAKTFVTDFAIAFLLVGLDLCCLAQKIVLITGYVLFAVGVILTVVSGVNYIVKNKQILSDN